MIVFLDYKIIIFNSNGNDFCPLATYLYKYLTLIVLKKLILSAFTTYRVAVWTYRKRA